MEMHAVRFIDRTNWSDDTATFRFERPGGYGFVPGQYALFGVETADGQERKPFTIASAPGDDWLEITTRLTGSPFKNALDALRPAGEIAVSAPAGRLTLPHGASPVAFLIGGVGVTPAHSMLRDAVQRETGLQAVVFFGNRGEGGIPYKAELDAMSEHGITLVHVLERPDPDWTGETGFISADVVRRHAHVEDVRAWLTSGPPVMVEAMERVFDELGVPQDLRLVERFGGYR